jgi:spore maturation protein CgeB
VPPGLPSSAPSGVSATGPTTGPTPGPTTGPTAGPTTGPTTSPTTGGPGSRSSLGRARFGRRPRILFLRFQYFLEPEILAALAAMDVETAVLTPRTEAERTPEGYGRLLLDAARSFKPDFLLSVNLLGLDPDGRMAGIMDRMGAGWAVWFVDNPELFLHGTTAGTGAGGPGFPGRTRFFCCDPDHAARFAALGLGPSHELPLACDASRFDLDAPVDYSPHPEREVLAASFIGATWVDKLAACHRDFHFPAGVLRRFKEAARDLAGETFRRMAGGGTVVTPGWPVLSEFLAAHHPGFWAACLAMDAPMRRGALHLVCWEANRLYRLACVRSLLPFSPLVAGDRHWPRLLGEPAGHWLHHPPIAYHGPDLARFYRLAKVNFCCSGVQMPRAVTQRAFDVPAAGGFPLLDARDQLAACFEIGREAVCYRTVEEIPELVERYGQDRAAARKVVEAARARIRAEHTYRHRLERLIGVMREG